MSTSSPASDDIELEAVAEQPADAPEIPWLRLDARMIWVDALRTVVSLIPTAVALLVFGVEPTLSDLWPPLVVAVVGTLGAVADVLRWVKTRYRVTPEHVERRTGLIVRKYRTVRRDRIRSVDTSARLRHRLAGLRLVTINAGSQAVAGSTFNLDAVSKDAAEHLRRELTRTAPVVAGAERSAEVETAADATEDDQTEVIAELDWRWVLYNMANFWAYVTAAGLLWGLYWTGRMVGIDAAAWVQGLLDWDAIGVAWTVVIALVVVGLIGVAGLAVAFVFEYWHFQLARVRNERGVMLRTSQGLLRTRELNRDENRMRGVEIAEPLFWRWMGATDTTVITTGLTMVSMSPGAMILPRTPRADALRVAGAVLGGQLRPVEAEFARHPRAALGRRVVRALLISAALTGLLGWLGATGALPDWPVWVGVATLPVGLALAVVGYLALGHRIVGDYAVVRSGAMSRATSALQRRAVIGVTMRQSVLQRRLGLVTIGLTTAAGNGVYQARDVGVSDGVTFALDAAPDLLDPWVSGRAVPPPDGMGTGVPVEQVH